MNARISAAFSYLAYNPRGQVNDIDIPAGWDIDTALSNGWGFPQNDRFGFGANVYLEGSAATPTRVVIAYRGTEGSDDGAAVDWINNVFLASGLPSPQLGAAIDRYLEVAKKYPNAEISFTGHSLGGGLASLVAMLFGHSATTFAQAPFEFGMLDPALALVVKDRLQVAGIADSDPIAQRFYDFYFSPNQDPGTAAFQRSEYDLRQDAIEVYAISGEIVSQGFPVSMFPDAAGTWHSLDVTGTDLSDPFIGAVDRHRMSLHLAGVMSSTFLQATREVSSFLPLMFDKALYETDTRKAEQTFIAGLLRKHVEQTSANYGTGDSALERFAQQALLIRNIAGVGENSELEATHPRPAGSPRGPRQPSARPLARPRVPL